jgi:hypothetical protein
LVPIVSMTAFHISLNQRIFVLIGYGAASVAFSFEVWDLRQIMIAVRMWQGGPLSVSSPTAPICRPMRQARQSVGRKLGQFASPAGRLLVERKLSEKIFAYSRKDVLQKC